MRERVSPDEWRTRIDLAACYRLVHHYGMDDLVYNHISARVPGEEGHFLINAYGLMYDEITASSLVKVDFEGNVVLDSGTGYGINQAGFVIHSAVHKGVRLSAALSIPTRSPAWRSRRSTAACCRSRRPPCTSTASGCTNTRASRSTSTSKSAWYATLATTRR